MCRHQGGNWQKAHAGTSLTVYLFLVKKMQENNI